MVWLLLPVQAMELLRVILNYAGAEQTTTEPIVQTVADIHLAYMPYSHSIFSALTFSLLAWVILAKGLRKRILGVAVGLGVLSHLILDLLTHAADISLASFIREPRSVLACIAPCRCWHSYLNPIRGYVLDGLSWR
jgi:hypothetical protein